MSYHFTRILFTKVHIFVIAIFADYPKAFDNIDSYSLIQKMQLR